MKRFSRGIATAVCLSLIFVTAASRLAAEGENADTEKHSLRYKFKVGEVVEMEVLHLATTSTRIQGNTQRSKMRSVSIKQWRIKEVKDDSISFEQTVTKVDMAKEQTGRPKVSYNSQTDKEAPADYAEVASTVGKVVAKVTMAPHGEILKREEGQLRSIVGMGPMVFLLPEKPISVGESWHFPTNIEVNLLNGRVKRIKTREKYTLTKVANGVASIKVVTQVLTPVDDPRIEAQLMQQLNNGEVKFDIDAGRLIKQQMDWDEKVVGFNGPQSSMEYQARYQEKLFTEKDETVPQPVEAEAKTATAKATPTDKPKLRRR